MSFFLCPSFTVVLDRYPSGWTCPVCLWLTGRTDCHQQFGAGVRVTTSWWLTTRLSTMTSTTTLLSSSSRHYPLGNTLFETSWSLSDDRGFYKNELTDLTSSPCSVVKNLSLNRSCSGLKPPILTSETSVLQTKVWVKSRFFITLLIN